MSAVPVPEPEARTHGCEECLAIGQQWVHLRKCLECGHVGCCDNSIGKHATKHAHRAGHDVIRSLEPGEQWRFCYADGPTLSDRHRAVAARRLLPAAML